MKKTVPALFCVLALLLSSCVFVPRVGMTEKSWLKHTISSDLVYLEGNLRAYRSDGAFYYFRDNKLVTVNQTLLPADQVPASAPAVK